MLHQLLPHASLSLLFLTGILVVSAKAGLWPGLAASALSFLAYNFFFTPPQFTFKVDADSDLATLVFFLVMAAISGNLAARMHREMRERQASLLRLSRMFEFGRRMSSAAHTSEVLDALAQDLADLTDAAVVVLMPDENGELVESARAGDNGNGRLNGVMRTAGSGDSAAAEIIDGKLVLKLATGAGPAGLVIIDPAPQLDANTRLAQSLCDQAAIALGRTLLATDLDEARLVSEREQLRSALLSSLSHDLRTPLASVIGSTSSVLDCGPAISETNRTELLQNSLAEARRLDRYIQNLLDMTRIGQGKLKLERNWVDLHDIIAGAANRLGLVPGQAPLAVDVPSDIPLLWVHGALIEQAFVNLLDNAYRYSPEGGHIRIAAERQGERVQVDIDDQGPGIPEQEREKVFDMFHTAGDRAQGTGLGLAISRGMIVAHAGTIEAMNGPGGRGTRMRVSLPVNQAQGGPHA